MKSLVELFCEYHGNVSDKWDFSIREYDRLLSPYREMPVNILEIGVQNGGSLEVWGKYFVNAGSIIGCDIDHKCRMLEYNDPRIAVVIGDVNELGTQKEILSYASQLDLIIDDGSHLSGDTIKTFISLFPRLTHGGMYVVEDLHCSYWREYQGGLFYPASAMSFFRRLTDVINYEHWGVNRSREGIFSQLAAKYNIEVADAQLEEVHSVEFLNSMCVIRKLPVASNQLGRRCVFGHVAKVYPILESLTERDQLIPSQADNPWANLAVSPEDAWETQNKKIFDLAEHLSEWESQLLNSKEQVSVLYNHTNKLDGRLIDPDLHINNVRATVKEFQSQIADLKKSVSDYEIQVSNLGKELTDQYLHSDALARELELMRNSTSWVITSPGRWIGRKVREVHEFLYTVVAACERMGGWAEIFGRSIRILRRDGVSGLKEKAVRFSRSVSMDTKIICGSSNRNSYKDWVLRYDTMNDLIRNDMRNKVGSMSLPPRISVIMPVYNPNPEWLAEAIMSVRNQIYPYWELCIADDASSEYEVRILLKKHAEQDSRIKVVFREDNGHISEASNSALTLATGSWIALLDHDDVLPEQALYWVADTILKYPNAAIFYSDEDKIDASGLRFSPHFKSDWNPDLFCGQNYISHLGVYSRQLIDEIGGFRSGFEGSQDYDLLLRCLRHLNDDPAIVHIPRILYHWRAVAGSTAYDPDAKAYTSIAGLIALKEYFASKSSEIAVEVGPVCNTYRVRYPLPRASPLVSLLIPTRDHWSLLERCVRSILDKTTYPSFEIVIIDNASAELETIRFLEQITRQDGRVRVLQYDKKFNFSAINNFGVQQARGSIIGLINNDVEVIAPEWLSEMVAQAIRPDIGCVGAKLIYGNNTLQHAGVVLGIGRVAGHSHKYFHRQSSGYFNRLLLVQSVSAVTAACLVVRRTVYEQVEGLDEKNLAVAFNDIDFCLRVREAGYRNLWTPYAELYHHESMTRGAEDTLEKQARFRSEVAYMLEKWHVTLSRDPYYNPNLTLLHEDFSLAWPPRMELPPVNRAEIEEEDYLLRNPDVARAVAGGQCECGWQHFKEYGAGEGRIWG